MWNEEKRMKKRIFPFSHHVYSCITVSNGQPIARTIYRTAAGYHIRRSILVAAHSQSGLTSVGKLAVARLVGRIQYLCRAIHGKSSYITDPVALAVALDTT